MATLRVHSPFLSNESHKESSQPKRLKLSQCSLGLEGKRKVGKEREGS